MKRENVKIILTSTVTLILYFIWILLTQLIYISGVSSTNLITSFLVTILFLGLFIFGYHVKLKKDYKAFLTNQYYKKLFIYSIVAIVIFFVALGITKLNNFGYITNMSKDINLMPINGLFKALIFAPIVEEIVFRTSFRNVIKQKSLFILTSSLIYGFLHVAFISNEIGMLIESLPFVICGLILSCTYVKYDNLVLNILVSFFCSASFLLVLLI